MRKVNPAALQRRRAPSRQACEGCQIGVSVVPVITQITRGISVVTFACNHTVNRRRCGKATAVVLQEFRYPRYFFADTFEQLHDQLVTRYGEDVRWM